MAIISNNDAFAKKVSFYKKGPSDLGEISEKA
jgi:hypothetical protein